MTYCSGHLALDAWDLIQAQIKVLLLVNMSLKDCLFTKAQKLRRYTVFITCCLHVALFSSFVERIIIAQKKAK